MKNLNEFRHSALTRVEMKNVIGGGDCRLKITKRADGSTYYTARDYSVSEAKTAYNNAQEYKGGYYTSGYCCANCPY